MKILVESARRKTNTSESSNDAVPNNIEIVTGTKLAQNIDANTNVGNVMDNLEHSSCSSTEIQLTSVDSISGDQLSFTPKKRKFHDARYFGEVTSSDVATPRRARRTLILARQQINKQRLKMRAAEQQIRRLRKKITSLQKLITHLKEKNVLSENAGDTIMDNMPQSMQQLISRKLKSAKRKYCPELRSFALSLQFYSSKAYQYVRKTWKNLLPHPSTLRAWYSIVDGKPGFTSEALKAIALRVKESKVILNFVIDEMAIREQIIFDKNQFYGGVNMGTGITQENDNFPLAKNALVFMAVAVNGGWKVPVGYFLIKSLTGSERANLLTRCLELLHDTGALVHSLTFDGAPVNLSMCMNLGSNFNYGSNNFKPYIIHPITKSKVFVFFDACHMIKLVRNTLGDKGIIVDQDDNKINWSHITQLNEVQMDEGLHLATKISNKHINFQNNRMSVRLAVQTLSASVCNALLYLKSTKYLPAVFDDCESTAKFCSVFNNIFDLLNSKNKFAKHNKFNIPVDSRSYDTLTKEATVFINYVKELKDPSGVRLIEGSRKTGFVGIIINLINVFEYYNMLKKDLDYILTFKFSQDFLETFFSAIRSRGGFNNNPNAKQFESAYKRLLIRNEIKLFDTSNCLADGLDILNVSSQHCKSLKDPIFNYEEYDNNASDIFDHDYINTIWKLNNYVENVIEYIAGFIVSKIIQLPMCNVCKKYLVTDKEYILIKLKNRGKLIYPSEDVVRICKTSERLCRQHMHEINKPNIKSILANKILNLCLASDNIFSSGDMLEHVKSQNYLDNHITQLVKIIIDIFLNVRLSHESKLASMKSNYIRCKYSRLILFNNQ